MEITTGNVDVELYSAGGSEKHTLRCRISAWQGISRHFGGFVPALRSLQTYDHAAYVAIIAFGLDKPAKDVEELVWRTGLPALVEPLTDYLARMMRGGRKEDDAKAAA